MIGKRPLSLGTSLRTENQKVSKARKMNAKALETKPLAASVKILEVR